MVCFDSSPGRKFTREDQANSSLNFLWRDGGFFGVYSQSVPFIRMLVNYRVEKKNNALEALKVAMCSRRCYWQRSLRSPLPCWRYRYQDVPASALIRLSFKYTRRCRSSRLPSTFWRYWYQDIPASESALIRLSLQIHSKMSLTKEFKIAIALLEIPVSGCTCFSTSVWVSNALEDVIDKGVQDRHRLVGDTSIRMYLLPSQHWSIWVYKCAWKCHW